MVRRRYGVLAIWVVAVWSWAAQPAVVADPMDGGEEEDEDWPVEEYKGEEGAYWQQCVAGKGAGMKISDLFAKITENVNSLLVKRAEVTLAEEGVDLVGHLCELHASDFESLKLPALLKSRLRRIRERGGKIPDEMLGHGMAPEAGGTPGEEGNGEPSDGEEPGGGGDPSVDLEGHDEL